MNNTSFTIFLKDPAKVAQIKVLYKSLFIPDEFVVYKLQSVVEINRLIQKISKDVPQSIFQNVLIILNDKNIYI